MSPGRCFRCSDYRGPVLDFGIDGWDGRLYLCFRCLDSAITVRGGATPDEVARYEALLNDAEDTIQQLRNGREELRREVVSDFAAHVLRQNNGAASWDPATKLLVPASDADPED